MRITPTASESAKWHTICLTLHLSGPGLKSSSDPAAPVVDIASSSPPRRKRSRISARSLMNLIVVFAESIIIGAAHVIAALFAEQFAFSLGQTAAAHRTVQHGFVLRSRFGSLSQRLFWSLVHRET